MATKAIETAAPAEVERRGRLTPEQVAEFRSFVQGLAVEDPEAFEMRQLQAVMHATTAEEILNAGVITKADAVIGHRLTIHTVRAGESDYEDGPDFYLFLEGYDGTDRRDVTVECGAADVVVKLARMAQLGLLPVTLRLHRKEKATRKGFFPIFAELAPPDFD
jgi:hypothetical protein